MRKIFLSIFLMLGVTAVYGQGLFDKSKVSGSFQIDGNYYWEDDGIGISAEDINGNKFGGYGFGKLQYQLGDFTAGMRFEAYQIFQMTGLPIQLNGMGVANFFATYDNGNIGVTVGDIYDQFGNGLIFRTYEEWTLGFDNSLRGIRAVYRPWNGVTIKGLYGKQRYYWASYDEERGLVRGVDGEWDLNQSIDAWRFTKLHATLGASFVSKYEADTKLQVGENDLVMPQNVASYAGRLNLGYGRFGLAAEYARKINDPSVFNTRRCGSRSHRPARGRCSWRCLLRRRRRLRRRRGCRVRLPPPRRGRGRSQRPAS